MVNILKEMRLKYGLTKSQVSQITGVSIATLHFCENATTGEEVVKRLSMKGLINLSLLYDIDVMKLYNTIVSKEGVENE